MDSPQGFKNLGNTCFINSILQCLRSCYSFVEEFVRYTDQYSPLVNSLQILLSDVSAHEKEIKIHLKVLQKDFKKYIGYHGLGSEQEDAHEFLLFILIYLHQQLNEIRTQEIKEFGNSKFYHLKSLSPTDLNQRIFDNDSSVVGKFFIGTTCHTAKCLRCNEIEKKSQFFVTLNIPIVKSTQVTLAKCFEKYVEETMIDFDNAVMCSFCFHFGPMLIKTSVEKWPKYLIIHIQRAIYHNTVKKCSVKVECPINLELPVSSNGIVKYQLVSFSKYSGNSKSGHYTSFCQSISEKWFHLNDGGSKPILISDVQKKSSKAYIMFYKQSAFPNIGFIHD